MLTFPATIVLAVTGPLDDALRSADISARLNAEREKKASLERAFQVDRLRQLASDFLRRMNRAGNPGTSQMKTSGGHIDAWTFFYVDETDHSRSFMLTPDGVPHVEEFRRFGRTKYRNSIKPATELSIYLDKKELNDVAASMARLIRRYNAE